MRKSLFKQAARSRTFLVRHQKSDNKDSPKQSKNVVREPGKVKNPEIRSINKSRGSDNGKNYTRQGRVIHGQYIYPSNNRSEHTRMTGEL